MKRKLIITGLVALMVVLAMAGCSNKSDTAEDSSLANTSASEDNDTAATDPAPMVVENMEESVVGDKINLAPVELEEGESYLNGSEYIKRSLDESGSSVYVVKDAGTEEEMQIPMDNTVSYSSEDVDQPYMEKIELSYTVNGEPTMEEQYRVYTSNKIVVDSSTGEISGNEAMMETDSGEDVTSTVEMDVAGE